MPSSGFVDGNRKNHRLPEDKKGFSQTDLADKSGVSRVMIGTNAGKQCHSIDAAKKNDALEVSLAYS